MARSSATTEPAVRIFNRKAKGQVLLICEHASAAMPTRYKGLGLPKMARTAHIAWDPGALGLAKGLSTRLDATLVAGAQSRLIYDLNRPPHAASAMATRSEAYEIPGNVNLSLAERRRRTENLYQPFSEAIHTLVTSRLAEGRSPILVTVHSYTPVYGGKPRKVQLGIIHDADPSLAQDVAAEAKARLPLATALNQPYDASDGVTHTLRLHATPYGLKSVMLEVRNDLIATPEAQDAMAASLATVLSAALARVSVEGAA